MDVNSFMTELLNMSFAGSVAAVIVWMVRVLLHRFLKGYSYILWIFVLFRLLCPFVLPFPGHVQAALHAGAEGVNIGARYEMNTKEADNLAIPIEMKTVREETWGTNVKLEYASEQRIVIRGYFGLVVCDSTGKEAGKNDHWKITHTLDLSAIGVRDMQGGGNAEMYVGKEWAVICPTAYLTASVIPENPTAYIYTFSSDSKEDDLVQISEGINEQIMAVISELELEEMGAGEYHSLYQNVYEIASDKIREEYGTGMIGDMRQLHETEKERWGFLAADGDKVEDIWYGIYDAETGEIIRVDLF